MGFGVPPPTPPGRGGRTLPTCQRVQTDPGGGVLGTPPKVKFSVQRFVRGTLRRAKICHSVYFLMITIMGWTWVCTCTCMSNNPRPTIPPTPVGGQWLLVVGHDFFWTLFLSL